MRARSLATAERQADTTRQTRAQGNSENRTIAETAGLTRVWADAQIDTEATVDAARAEAFAAMQTRSAQAQTPITDADRRNDPNPRDKKP